MVEWSITVVLKTTVLRGTGGSNPSLSANNAENQQVTNLHPDLHPLLVNLGVILHPPTSSMNRDVNQEGQAVFGSLKGVKVVGKRTDTVIDVTSSTLQA